MACRLRATSEQTGLRVSANDSVEAFDEAIEKARPRPKLSKRLGRIADMLEKSGIDLDEVGTIDKIRVGEHQTPVKIRKIDADGNPYDELEIVTSKADSLVITPSWVSGPDWPVVQQAPPAKITPTKSKRTVVKGWYKAFILPDIQFGFRRYEDGRMDPFHDEHALDVALQVISDVRPDRIIMLGDTDDLPMFGKYEQEPEFAMTAQATFDRHHRFLCDLRATAPEADIDEIEGNHDKRLRAMIARNAMAALRLRRANQPDSWPVMSIPHLTHMDELGVKYHDGYPATEVWVNDNLVCIHGVKVNSAGSTAQRVIQHERVSVIHGHIHRVEKHHKTRRTRDGRRENFVASPGCLCRVDGSVPSVKGATDYRGNVVETWENWQQGFAVVTFQEGDGRFDYEQISIFDGTAIYRDHEYESTVERPQS